MEQQMNTDIARMTAEIVAAHLTRTALPTEEVTAFMLKVRDQLLRIAQEDDGSCSMRRIHPDALRPGLIDERWPGVYVDRIICLDDGREVKLLRSYLTKRYGMKDVEYRRRWNLPSDYPFSPPEYAQAKRSEAQAGGLGTRVRGRPETNREGGMAIPMMDRRSAMG